MITIQDLIDRFGEHELANLTDRDNYTVINTDIVEKAINDATAEAESYLKTTGLVSRTSHRRLIYTADKKPPEALVIKLCDIARYYLYEDGTTTIVETRYKQAIDWLKLVMKNPKMLTGVLDNSDDSNGSSGIHVIPNPVPNMWTD